MKKPLPYKYKILLGAVFTAGLTFIIYLAALKNGFVDWDDNIYVYQNRMITSFNMEFIKWSFTNFSAFNWHPLTWMSHALDFALWGLNPTGHHLTSVIFHSVDTFLVTLLVIRLLEIGIDGPKKTETRGDSSRLAETISPPLREEDKGEGKLISADHPHPNPPPLRGRENPSMSTNLNQSQSVSISLNSSRLSQNGLLVGGITAGLLFGLHPLQVESAAWISERKDVLSACFFLLSILSYLRYAYTPLNSLSIEGKQGPYSPLKRGAGGVFIKILQNSYFFRKHYLLCLAFFLLGLLSKPMVITLPAVLLILDWYPLKRLNGSGSLIHLLYEKIPFLLLSLASAVVTVLAQRGALASFAGLPLTSRLLSAAKSLIVYLEKMLWPAGLMPFHPYPAHITLLSPGYFIPVLFLVVITSVCIFVLKTKKQRIWLSAWAYYIITMLPVIGIVQVGKQEFADRYTYLPSIGPFILIGIASGLFFEILRNRKTAVKVVSIFVPLVIIFSISYATVIQIGVWKDGVSLWSREIEALRRDPGKEYLFLNIPFYNRGAAYADRGCWDQAIEDFSYAIYLNSVDFTAYYMRGAVYANKKEYQNAVNDYDMAIYLSPNTPDIYYGRAFVYVQLGRYPEAVDDITKAINLSAAPPSDYYYNRGMIFKKLGYEKEAAEDFAQAQNIDTRNSRR
jgi:tetratricopeptide (TPR) repeat protein